MNYLLYRHIVLLYALRSKGTGHICGIRKGADPKTSTFSWNDKLLLLLDEKSLGFYHFAISQIPYEVNTFQHFRGVDLGTF